MDNWQKLKSFFGESDEQKKERERKQREEQERLNQQSSDTEREKVAKSFKSAF